MCIIIFESIVLGIYLWFKIYFLIDTNAKMWTEITDIVIFRKKLLKFRQGVLACPTYYCHPTFRDYEIIQHQDNSALWVNKSSLTFDTWNALFGIKSDLVLAEISCLENLVCLVLSQNNSSSSSIVGMRLYEINRLA